MSTQTMHPGTMVDARLVSRGFILVGHHRELLLGLEAGEQVAAEVKLLCGGRTVAHQQIATLGPGRRDLAIPIADATATGTAELRLTLSDRGGNFRTIHQAVQLPAG